LNHKEFMDLHAAFVASMRSYFAEIEKSSAMLAECTAKPLPLKKRLTLASQDYRAYRSLDLFERQESAPQCGAIRLWFCRLIDGLPRRAAQIQARPFLEIACTRDLGLPLHLPNGKVKQVSRDA
jgi:hypothetical protein